MDTLVTTRHDDTSPAPGRMFGSADTLHRIEEVSASRGDEALGKRVAELRTWIEADLHDVEETLRSLDRAPTPMHGSANHLLSLGGKRLRPMCVALAARVGTGFNHAARDLAVAAELVHSATLLHDDVVDMGELRRGAPTSRIVYGNAASIFAGDWLLVEAIARIRSTGLNELLDKALCVLRAMLGAEALQLAARGKFAPDVDAYFRVVEGKTASLFEWALYAGGRAGQCTLAQCNALESFGKNLGVAFQLMDDVLDVAGDATLVGKSMFSDLREGKLTYPLLLAVERDRDFGTALREACLADTSDISPDLARRVTETLRTTGALEDTLVLARKLSHEGTQHLASLPPGRARESLESVAAAMLQRKK
jgi:octaprenyl-diphosphate synthase